MIKPGPIVITLKKRGPPGLGAGKPEEAPPPEPPDAPAARSRSRSKLPSRAGSSDRSSRSPPVGKTMLPLVSSSKVLNVAALENIFTRFHEEMDTWLQAESVKLERAELKGSSCREDFDSCTQQVVDFLKDHNPDGLADVGSDPRGDGFVTRTLPHFLEFIDEDQKALKELSSMLSSFIEQRLPGKDDLLDTKGDSPVSVLKALLPHMGKVAPAAMGDPNLEYAPRQRGHRRRRRAGEE